MVKGGRNSFTSDAHAYVCVVVKKLTSAFRAENEKLSFFLFVFYFVFFFFHLQLLLLLSSTRRRCALCRRIVFWPFAVSAIRSESRARARHRAARQ